MAPVYSHLTYDIGPDAQIRVRRPDILIVEASRPPAGEVATRRHVRLRSVLLHLLSLCRC